MSGLADWSLAANQRPVSGLMTNERPGLCDSVYLCDDLETESSQPGHYCHSVTRTWAQLSQTANQKWLGEDQPSVMTLSLIYTIDITFEILAFDF